LTSLFYLLLTNPKCYELTTAEVDKAFTHGEQSLDGETANKLQYLSACLNEALRLYPPVPTNGGRQVVRGSGGKIVAGRLIPEQTEVYVPHYSLHRDPRYFSPCPEEFRPDRWLENGTTNQYAFIPFSYGPANCAGKALARMEMLMVASAILHHFHMEFATDFDVEGWPKRYRDIFVASIGSLDVVLSQRQ